MSLLEEFYKGHMIVVNYDEVYQDESPREWDNFGTMMCWHNRYILGDKHKHNSPENFIYFFLADNHEDLYDKLERYCERKGNQLGYNWGATLEELMAVFNKVALVLPLYLYDHNGISMSTSSGHYPFCDPWDSGQIGFIYITYEDLKKEFKRKKLSKKLIERGEEYLRQEVDTYDRYLRGEYYKYEIYPCVEEEEDYVWDDDDCVADGYGFISEEFALSEAKNTVDYLIKENK